MKKTKLYIHILYMAAYLILFWGYYSFIVPFFAYTKFEWSPNPIKIVESLFFLFVVLIFMPTVFKKPSDILVHLQLLFPILGMLVIYGAADESRPFMIMTIFSFILIVLISSKVNFGKIKRVKIHSKVLMLMLFSFSILIPALIVFISGTKNINFDILRVYEFRSAAGEALPKLFGYLNPIAGKILFPVLLLLGLIRKNWILILSGIGGGVMMFALTSHKGPLFYPLLLLGVYYGIQIKRVIPALLIAAILMVLLPLAVYAVYPDFFLINSLLLRRVYFVPGNINFIYYDFFSSNPFVYWASSKFTLGLVNYPYDIGTSHLIGREYFSSELAGANTGWIGSGYMHLGFLGMMIYSLVVGGVLSLMNSFSRTIGKIPVLALSIVPLFSLMTSSDLPTGFLTHGLLVLILILSLMSNPQKKARIANGNFSSLPSSKKLQQTVKMPGHQISPS